MQFRFAADMWQWHKYEYDTLPAVKSIEQYSAKFISLKSSPVCIKALLIFDLVHLDKQVVLSRDQEIPHVL
jgi:hypothetical protein